MKKNKKNKKNTIETLEVLKSTQLYGASTIEIEKKEKLLIAKNKKVKSNSPIKTKVNKDKKIKQVSKAQLKKLKKEEAHRKAALELQAIELEYEARKAGFNLEVTSNIEQQKLSPKVVNNLEEKSIALLEEVKVNKQVEKDQISLAEVKRKSDEQKLKAVIASLEEEIVPFSTPVLEEITEQKNVPLVETKSQPIQQTKDIVKDEVNVEWVKANKTPPRLEIKPNPVKAEEIVLVDQIKPELFTGEKIIPLVAAKPEPIKEVTPRPIQQGEEVLPSNDEIEKRRQMLEFIKNTVEQELKINYENRMIKDGWKKIK